MKNSGILILGVLLFSCGESVSEQSEDPQSSVEEISKDSSSLNTDTLMVEEEQWQIDQYVEFLVGEEVHNSPQEFDWDDEKMHWYFKELDLAGGYAKIEGAVEGWEEFVLYRMESGEDLVLKKSVTCGPVCDYYQTFFKGKREDMKQIEFDVILPMEKLDEHRDKISEMALERLEYPLDYPEFSQYDFLFPKKGTTLKIDLVLGADELRMALADLSWDKSIFSIEQLYETLKERE